MLERVPTHTHTHTHVKRQAGSAPFSSAVVSFCTLSEEALTKVTAHTRGCECRHWSTQAHSPLSPAVLPVRAKHRLSSHMHARNASYAQPPPSMLVTFLPCSFRPHCTDYYTICAYVHPPLAPSTIFSFYYILVSPCALR